MSKSTRIVSMISVALLSAWANATVIHFDELGVPGYVFPDYSGTGFVSQGFSFSGNMDVIDVSPSGGWWSDGVGSGHSGNYAALNDFGGSMVMTQVGGGTFSVEALWLNGWQGIATTSSIEAYLNGVLVDSLIVSYSSPWVDISLGFVGVDELKISGGTFLVDDISVNGGNGQVPEPATLSLMALGCFGAGILARRNPA